MASGVSECVCVCVLALVDSSSRLASRTRHLGLFAFSSQTHTHTSHIDRRESILFVCSYYWCCSWWWWCSSLLLYKLLSCNVKMHKIDGRRNVLTLADKLLWWSCNPLFPSTCQFVSLCLSALVNPGDLLLLLYWSVGRRENLQLRSTSTLLFLFFLKRTSVLSVTSSGSNWPHESGQPESSYNNLSPTHARVCRCRESLVHFFFIYYFLQADCLLLQDSRHSR